jgi:hypothetical protein
MKLPIHIEYANGESAIYIAQVPEWSKWEQKTGNTITQAQDKVGLNDLLFLAYHAMKRNAGGKAVKPYEVWCEGIVDVNVGDENPKVSSAEA